MQNSNSRSEGTSTFKNVGDRIMGVIQTVGADALEELKTGIDKAWDEIKLGIDEGLNSATEGFNKAWIELSGSIERAKDDLLRKQTGTRKATSRAAADINEDDDNIASAPRTKPRKDQLS